LGYFHPPDDESENQPSSPVYDESTVFSGRSSQKPPPDITGIAAGYTDNGSWIGGIGHSASWRQDTIRYLGAGAVGGDDPSFETGDDIYSGGAGIRYHFMPEQGLWLGVDIARGPEDWHWYVKIGHAW